jgi:hypothetical protein
MKSTVFFALLSVCFTLPAQARSCGLLDAFMVTAEMQLESTFNAATRARPYMQSRPLVWCNYMQVIAGKLTSTCASFRQRGACFHEKEGREYGSAAVRERCESALAAAKLEAGGCR